MIDRHWYEPTPLCGCGRCGEHRDAAVHFRVDERMDATAERQHDRQRETADG